MAAISVFSIGCRSEQLLLGRPDILIKAILGQLEQLRVRTGGGDYDRGGGAEAAGLNSQSRRDENEEISEVALHVAKAD
jgi:hypothetical protein